MEQEKLLVSALTAGAAAVGIYLAFDSALSRWTASADTIHQELLRLVIDGKDSEVTFDDFPYYLSERTREVLTNQAYAHLKHLNITKHTRNLSPASRAILLSGPAELYLQMLVKALAHHFEAKLLLLDLADFSFKMQSKKSCTKKDFSISEVAFEWASSFLGCFSMLSSKEDNGGHSRHVNNWAFDKNELIQSLYKVLVSIPQTSCMILYIRDADKLFYDSPILYVLFKRMLEKISGSILVLGSRMLDETKGSLAVNCIIRELFPYNIEIRPPENETHLLRWKTQLEEDRKKIQFQDNKNHIAEVLAENDIECDDLGSICHANTLFLSDIKKIVVSAISYHLMNNKDPEYRNGKLVISSNSLCHGLSIFEEGKKVGTDTLKTGISAKLFKDIEAKSGNNNNPEKSFSSKPLGTEVKSSDKNTPKKQFSSKPLDTEIKSSNKNTAEKSFSSKRLTIQDADLDNEFEMRIRSKVIPANEIGVAFSDIGALEEIKESLHELVMLPLRRPELFNGGLLKPCRGILLFGPPGTGKTMLAKAIAHEAGASFMNVSMSTLASKWFGESEKFVRAVFTLAAKISPTIIFIDEVDSMLGQRSMMGEYEGMRKIKNEFMSHWDGLLTKSGERILVLAATNRPSDLDEAIIRRFERRIMVDLPSVKNREMILRTLLSKEKVEKLDFKEIAAMTEGYSGSDLKNLCVTAAYRPVRELMQRERAKNKKKVVDGEKISGDASITKAETKKKKVIALRPLNMEDIRQAKNQVAASYSSEGSVTAELKQWNSLYGEGGSRKKEQLSYFV